MKRENRTLILGIGNMIRGDDGIGIRLVRKLKETLPSEFEIKEAAAAGLELIGIIAGFSRAIIIDAIQTSGGKPGQVYRLSPEEFKRACSYSSAHALGLIQIVELGKKLMGSEFPQVEVLGIEAREIGEFSQNLSPELEKQFSDTAEAVRNLVIGSSSSLTALF